MTQNCPNWPKNDPKLPKWPKNDPKWPQKNSTDISAASATFCISGDTQEPGRSAVTWKPLAHSNFPTKDYNSELWVKH